MATPVTFSPTDIDTSAPAVPQNAPTTQPGASGQPISAGQPITFSPADIDHNVPPVAQTPEAQQNASYGTPEEQAAAAARHAKSAADHGNQPVAAPPTTVAGKVAQTATNVLSGAGKTIGGDINSLSSMANKVLPNSTQIPISTNDTDLQPGNTAEDVGSVGANILEFIAGDGALKGLSIASKIGMAGKVAEIAENSPKIAKALDIGMNAIRTGSVGAAQGLVKGETPGQAATTGAVTGVFSGAGDVLSEGAQAVSSKLADYVTKFAPTVFKELELPTVDLSMSKVLDANGNSVPMAKITNPETADTVVTHTIPAEKTVSPLAQLAKKYGPGVVTGAIISQLPASTSTKLMLEYGLVKLYGWKVSSPEDAGLAKQVVDRPEVINAAKQVADAVNKFSSTAPVAGSQIAQGAQK